MTLRSRIVTPTQGAEGAVPQRPESQRGPLSSGETEAAAGQLQGSSDDGKRMRLGAHGHLAEGAAPSAPRPLSGPAPAGQEGAYLAKSHRRLLPSSSL